MSAHRNPLRPNGTFHKSPARSAGLGASRFGVLKGRFMQGAARLMGSAPGDAIGSTPHDPSLQDGMSLRSQPGTACRAIMSGPVGTFGGIGGMIALHFSSLLSVVFRSPAPAFP